MGKIIFIFVFFIIPAVISFYKNRTDISLIFIIGLIVIFVLEKRKDLVDKYF